MSKGRIDKYLSAIANMNDPKFSGGSLVGGRMKRSGKPKMKAKSGRPRAPGRPRKPKARGGATYRAGAPLAWDTWTTSNGTEKKKKKYVKKAFAAQENPWINFLKHYAADEGITYSEALGDPQAKAIYKGFTPIQKKAIIQVPSTHTFEGNYILPGTQYKKWVNARKRAPSNYTDVGDGGSLVGGRIKRSGKPKTKAKSGATKNPWVKFLKAKVKQTGRTYTDLMQDPRVKQEYWSS